MKVFIYNDILRKEIQDKMRLQPIREEIATVEGKIYIVSRTPVLLHTKDIARNRGNRRVFGAILTFEDSDAERVIQILDAYHGSSQSRVGLSSPYDLMYRTTIKAFPLKFESIQELETFNYKTKKEVDCIVYMGNLQHERVPFEVKVSRRHKLVDGFYKKGMQDILKRKGYLKDVNKKGSN